MWNYVWFFIYRSSVYPPAVVPFAALFNGASSVDSPFHSVHWLLAFTVLPFLYFLLHK